MCAKDVGSIAIGYIVAVGIPLGGGSDVGMV